MNILITTLGTSWQIIPELYGFTNPEDYNFYKKHNHYDKICSLRTQSNIQPVNEIWIVTTDNENIQFLEKWHSFMNGLKIKIFQLKNVEDLNSILQCRQMGDLIYKVVHTAKRLNPDCQLLVSLSGGRKTMSADIIEAGNIFGCNAMIHVINTGNIPYEFNNLDLVIPPESKYASLFFSVITYTNIEESLILSLDPPIKNNDEFLIKIKDKKSFEIYKKEPDTNFYDEIEKRKLKSRNIAYNFYLNFTEKEINKNFYSLYFLHPEKINFLKNKKISNGDYNFIQKFPKAELHCHLGGIATPEEIIEIALSEKNKIKNLCDMYPEFKNWLNTVKKAIIDENYDWLKDYFKVPKALRKKFPNINEPYTIAGFLIQFQDNPELLENLIYMNKNFSKIGIENYEKLGDFQGSSLLQTENTIRKACKILLRKCNKHNVKYIELRCSPINYTKGNLNPEKVVNILIDEFYKLKSPIVKLIFIASRHRKMSDIYRHIELTEFMLESNEKFKEIFVGFDVAGNEEVKSPFELRDAFNPLLEKCLHITIHAGETQPVESIWEAVYHLNADRIGHGLTLFDNKELMNKIFERKIAIEMCPSSNFQIIGFNDYSQGITQYKDYPLEKYLKKGLRVTVNTDNLGISLTDFTKEYIKASNMSVNRLNLWNVLQLIRNSFISAFCNLETKKKLISIAEKEIMEILNKI